MFRAKNMPDFFISLLLVIIREFRSWGGVLDTTLCDKVFQ